MDCDKNLENALEIIIEQEGLKNVQIEYQELINSGNISDVKVINIKHDDSTLNLFLKRLPKSPCEVAKLVFTNEVNFYQNVLSELKKSDASISSFLPKCYYVDNELIILENLQASGMKVWDDLKIPLDEDHVVSVLKRYAKFHASSTVLKLRGPKVFEGISKKVDVLKFALMQLEGGNFRQSMGKKAAAGFSTEKRKYAEAFMAFVDDNLYSFLSEIFDDEEFDVIVHGDCWPHNFFFKYKESQISEMCLIDFQFSFIASPILDLSYFLCTSGCSKKNFDCIEKYLKLYHDSFSDEMKKLGFEAQQIIPFKTLLDQWRKHGKYGLAMGMIVNKMLVCDKDELRADLHDELLSRFDFISRNEHLYHQRMKDCIEYFYDNNML